MSTQVSSAVVEPPRTSHDTSLPVPMLAAAGILALAHLPLLIGHGKQLWLREHYQLFPIVLIFAGILAVPAYQAAIAAPSGPKARRIGWGLLALNWILLTTAIILDSSKLGAIAFWELLIAVAVSTGGKKTFKAAIPAFIYLLVIIPPPFQLDTKLVQSLQTFTARCSSRVLDQFGVLHALNGVIVESSGKYYEIEKACSGVSSLLSIFACTLFYVLWTKAHWLRACLLVLAAVFWVLMNNITRVVSIVFFDTRFGFDLSNDDFPFYRHTLLGVFLFCLTLGLVWSTDKFLQFLGSTVSWGDKQAKAKAGVRPTGDPPLSLSWGAVAPIAIAYGLLIAFQTGDYALAGGSMTESEINKAYGAFNAQTLPEKIEGWQRLPGRNGFVERDSDNLLDPMGAHSRTWRYVRGNVVASVSFDYPFGTFHDLRICYESIGWAIHETEYFNPLKDGREMDWKCTKAMLYRPIERTAYLMFGEFDANGNVIEPYDQPFSDIRFVGRFDQLKDRWSGVFGGKRETARARWMQVLQVQVFAESYTPLNEAEFAELTKLFVSSAEMIRAKCMDVLKTANK